MTSKKFSSSYDDSGTNAVVGGFVQARLYRLGASGEVIKRPEVGGLVCIANLATDEDEPGDRGNGGDHLGAGCDNLGDIPIGDPVGHLLPWPGAGLAPSCGAGAGAGAGVGLDGGRSPVCKLAEVRPFWKVADGDGTRVSPAFKFAELRLSPTILRESVMLFSGLSAYAADRIVIPNRA